MVHALGETWRVLKSAGTLVDLRPISTRSQIEAVTSDGAIEIAHVDATGMAEDDAAADSAIQRIVADRRFVRRRRREFTFDFYWDEFQEMASFLKGSRRAKHVDPTYPDLKRIHRELKRKRRGEVRLRWRRRNMIAVYEKLPRPESTPP